LCKAKIFAQLETTGAWFVNSQSKQPKLSNDNKYSGIAPVDNWEQRYS